ncbi:MAG TPA: PIN domain-containing protein [Candidatus Brocadiia bacterium]|nr:PIN domain-containing protein [Candidatus Brocadiia bacterium]
MKTLVDSSVCVAYFRGERDLPDLDWLLEESLVVTNELVLAELLPALLARGEKRLAGLLREVDCLPLSIGWDRIVEMQLICLRNGVNKVAFQT